MSFLKALAGGFTGSTEKKLINSSYATANKQYDKSNDLARSDINSGLAGGKGYIDPIVERGRTAGNIYEGSLGLRGTEGAGEANAAYLSNDYLAQIRADQLKRSAQLANRDGSYARGADGTNVGSGVGALADSRVMREGYGDWQNRLAGLQGSGDQAAMSGANLEFGAGQAQANREMSYGSAKGGAAIGQGAALAANSNTGINNLFKLGSLAVSAATGMPMGFSPNKLSGGGGGYGK